MKKILIFILMLLAALPGIAQHFTTVWTGNGINHMNINILEAKLSGINLAAGDEIAAFDGSLCVGVVSVPSSYTTLSIAASQSTNGSDGYTAGHAITLKYWDASRSAEVNATIKDNAGQLYNPVFIDRGSVFVKLSGKTALTISISADNKIYDGNSDANVPSGSVVADGVVVGQNVNVVISNAKFDNKNVGDNKLVTADVTINGADAGNYTVLPTVTTHANIIAKQITITPNTGQSKVYGSADPSLGYTFAPSLISPDVISGTLGRVGGENANTYAYTLGTLSAGSNYQLVITGSPATFAVTKASVTVIANAGSKTYGSVKTYAGTEFTTSGTFYFGDNVSSVNLSSTGDPVTALVNTYPIIPVSAVGTGLANYNIIYTNGVLTVDKASVTVIASAGSKTYGNIKTYAGTEFTTSGTFYNGDNISSVTLSSTGDLVTALVNTYPIVPVSAVGTGLANYNITYTNGVLTVDKALVTVIANEGSKTYGSIKTYAGTEFTTSGTFYNGDNISSVSLSSTGDPVTALVNTYPIVPVTAVGTGLANYNISYTNGVLTVNKASVTVIASAGSKTYGSIKTYTGTEFTTSGTFYNGDNISSVSLSSTGDPVTALVNTYPIVPVTAVGTGLANYNISYTNGVLTVNKASVTVIASAGSKTYGSIKTYAGTEFTTSGTFYNGDNISSVSLSSTGDPVSAFVNTYPIVPVTAVGTGLANYNISYTNGVLTVNKASVTVIANAGSKTYGSIKTYAGTEFTTSGTFFNGDNISSVSLSSTGDPVTALVNTYPIVPVTAVGTGLANYNISYTNGVLTVNKASVTVIASAGSKTYGSIKTYTGAEFTTSGTFFNGDNVSNVTLSSTGDPATVVVNTYPIVPANAVGTGLDNYNIGYINGVLTVTKATLTVTADPQTKVYGTANPTLTFQYSGWHNGDGVGNLTTVPTASTTVTTASTVGTYTGAISVTGGVASNYDFTYVAANFNVTNATLTITAHNLSKCFGQTLTFTGSDYTVSGLVNGNTVSAVTLTSTGSASGAAVGPHTITASNATGTGLTNYTIDYVTGTLTVNVLPVPTIAGLASVCIGATNVSYTTEGGKSAYHWTITGGIITDGGDSDNIKVTWNTSGPQTITVNYTNTATGCTAAAATVMNVTVNPLPTATISGTTTICAGTSADLSVALTGTAPWSITYTTNSGTPVTLTNILASPKVITVTPAAGVATTYAVTSVSDANTCSNSGAGTVTVTVRPVYVAPVATGIQTLCYGTLAADLSATVASGAGNSFSYKWQSSPDNSNWTDISPAQTGMSYSPGVLFASSYYRLLATDASCGSLGSNSVLVTVHDPLTKPVISSAQTICSGATAQTLHTTASLGSNGNFTYQWQKKTTGAWSDVGTFNSMSYDPGVITETTSFQVIANNVATPYCGASYSNPLTITVAPNVGTPVFAAGATSTRCQGAGSVTYGATAANASSISYSLDVTSAAHTGNSIIASTGEVTYATDWSGTTVITASAEGCNGPKTAIHTVTITPTVSLPVFTLGASAVCQNSADEQYTATATNSTSVTYTVIPSEAGVISSAGLMNWDAAFHGAATIRAIAYGCNGPVQQDKQVTVYTTLTAAMATGSKTICYGSNGGTLTAGAPSGGSLSYNYQWQVLSGATWGNVATAGTSSTYSPGTLFETTSYRVIISDGACSVVTSDPVVVTVYTPFTEPVIGSAQTICNGSTPAQLNSTAAQGGSGSFTYQWQYKTTGSWINVGTDALSYQPDALTTTTSFRLIANDKGSVSCGAIFSNEIVITVNSLVVAGTIGNDQQIASGTAPSPITSLTAGTTGTGYVYKWETSVNSGSSWTTTGITTAGYTPGILNQTTWYRRSVILTQNSIVCSAVAPVVKIIVEIKLNLQVKLEGPLNNANGSMNTVAKYVNRMPLSQPYNRAPWNYAGTESVGSIPAGVVDWILVELRQATSPAGATSATVLLDPLGNLAKRAVFLKNDGSIVELDGTTPVHFNNFFVSSGNGLYPVIRHRNHLAIMSATAVTMVGDVYTYDFTSGIDKAYGGITGYKLVAGRAAMVAGDIDKDGKIYVSDYNNWVAGFGTTNGYFDYDLDMDGDGYVSDYNKWAGNFGIEVNAGLKSAKLISGDAKPVFTSKVPE